MIPLCAICIAVNIYVGFNSHNYLGVLVVLTEFHEAVQSLASRGRHFQWNNLMDLIKLWTGSNLQVPTLLNVNSLITKIPEVHMVPIIKHNCLKQGGYIPG